MKNLRKIAIFLCLSGLLSVAPEARLHAEPAQRAPGPDAAEHMDTPENSQEIQQYRHSAVVQSIARVTHLSTETAALIFEDFNSGVLIFAIAAFLWKALPKIFRTRSETLRSELIGAREATEDANRRLTEVEARLSRLDSEIEAIRHQAETEMVEDEKRIHASLEAERERIVAAAEQEIAATEAAARRDLKKFAADLAIDHAMRRVQLSTDTDRALVREFGSRLKPGAGGKA